MTQFPKSGTPEQRGVKLQCNGIKGQGIQRHAVEWNGVEWKGIEWNGVEWNVQYGIERNGME